MGNVVTALNNLQINYSEISEVLLESYRDRIEF